MQLQHCYRAAYYTRETVHDYRMNAKNYILKKFRRFPHLFYYHIKHIGIG